VRLSIKTIAVAAVITAVATAVHKDADAALPASPLQPVAFTNLQRGAEASVPAVLQPPVALASNRQDVDVAFPNLSVQPVALTNTQQFKPDGDPPPAVIDGYSPLPVAYDYLPPLGPYLDASRRPDPASFDSANASNSSAETLQRVSLRQPEESASPAPARDLDPPAKRHASLQPSGRTDLPPARQSVSRIVRIQFDTPVLAPMSHTFFCLKYPDDCKVHKLVFRGGPVRLTAKRWAELLRVNAAVNRAIIPQPNTKGLAGEKWLISPKAGECHDYAVTKRHELQALGWPARDLLLSEVVTSWGEHHLVLVVRTSDGDFVADNLNANIRSWSKVPYQWVRIQSPGNPTFWSTLTSATVWAKGSGFANPQL
jgi:predicted transglutaminase-like cysteine proteinase